MGRNDLSKLHAEAFSTLGNLQKLVLDSCRLNELPVEVWANLFAGLDNLRLLLLQYNKLGELPAEVWVNMFSGLGSLQKLWLWGNGLSELPAICWDIKCLNFLRWSTEMSGYADEGFLVCFGENDGVALPSDRLIGLWVGLVPGYRSHSQATRFHISPTSNNPFESF